MDQPQPQEVVALRRSQGEKNDMKKKRWRGRKKEEEEEKKDVLVLRRDGFVLHGSFPCLVSSEMFVFLCTEDF